MEPTCPRHSEPQLRDSGRPLRAPEFKALLETCGLRFLRGIVAWRPEECGLDRNRCLRSVWTRRFQSSAMAHRTGVAGSALSYRRLIEGRLAKGGGHNRSRLALCPGRVTEDEPPSSPNRIQVGTMCSVPQPGAQHNLPQVPWFWVLSIRSCWLLVSRRFELGPSIRTVA